MGGGRDELGPHADQYKDRDIKQRGGVEMRLVYLRVYRVQKLCESRGGRPGLPVLMSLTVSVDVKQY